MIKKQKQNKAQIYKSTGSWYILKTKQGDFLNARIRGKIKLLNLRTTNPISVGDFVDYELEDNNENAWITRIYPRKNYIIRKSVNLSKETHIIASNIDLACVLFTIKLPETSLGFLDRFLINCEAYQIKPLILLNKSDLLDDSEMIYVDEILSLYNSIGYESLKISALNKNTLNNLIQKITNKNTLFFGHSGSGKSTLINTLIPDLKLDTKIISDFNQKGKHTTTFAQMYDISFGGSIIDTPGIKEFGIVDFEKLELQSYFPDIFQLSNSCKFHNCLHLNEPKCAIHNALKTNILSPERYKSYLTLMEECK